MRVADLQDLAKIILAFALDGGAIDRRWDDRYKPDLYCYKDLQFFKISLAARYR